MRFLVVAIILLIPFEVCGARWTVELDGSGDFVSLWDAVDSSASGDTLLLGPGRHDDVRQGAYYPARAVVEGKNLAFVGSPDGLTIVGPSEYDPESGLQHGVMTEGDVEVSFRDIVFENLFNATSNFDMGMIVVNKCRFDNCKMPLMFQGGRSYVDECSFSSGIEGSRLVFSLSQLELKISGSLLS